MNKPFNKFFDSNPAVWQFTKYAVLGIISSIVELAAFALCNYLVFDSLKALAFRFFLFDYDVSDGGLGLFLSLAVSYVAGWVSNFFIQRKYTFHSAANTVGKTLIFIAMITFLFLLQMWLPTVLRSGLTALMGADLAEFLIKIICMSSGLLISFPLNKYVIMRR